MGSFGGPYVDWRGPVDDHCIKGCFQSHLGYCLWVYTNPSAGWKQRSPGPWAQRSQFPSPDQVWPEKRPPVPTCDSYSCCSQLLITLVRHNERVPAPPFIKLTTALMMLFLYMWDSCFLAGFNQDSPSLKTFRLSQKCSVGFDLLVSWGLSHWSTMCEATAVVSTVRRLGFSLVTSSLELAVWAALMRARADE